MEEMTEETGQRRGGIFNYFGGATINNLVINSGTYTKTGEEHHHYDRKEKTESDGGQLSKEDVVRVVKDCQGYFWGNTSYAVLYCVMRDLYDYKDSASQFERYIEGLDYGFKRNYICAAGTIANAFKNNPYMYKHIDSWKQYGAKERVTALVEEMKNSTVYEQKKSA